VSSNKQILWFSSIVPISNGADIVIKTDEMKAMTLVSYDSISYIINVSSDRVTSLHLG
jgi:hypothetical protein